MNLQQEEACFGVIDGFEALRLGQKEDAIVREISSILSSNMFYENNQENIDINYLSRAEHIMRETFYIHDIPYVPKSTLKMLEQQAKWEQSEYNHFIKLLDLLAQNINPYNLPITTVKSHVMPGINSYLIASNTRGYRHVYTNIDMPQYNNLKKKYNLQS